MIIILIQNENDSEEQIHQVCDAISKLDLNCEFNLVRYNPADATQGVESSDDIIDRNMKIILDRFKFGGKVQIIQRVGFDVKASCGLFYS